MSENTLKTFTIKIHPVWIVKVWGNRHKFRKNTKPINNCSRPPWIKNPCNHRLPAPKSKKELQSYCGMISSLPWWFPNISFTNQNLRAGCSERKKLLWTPNMRQEFDQIRQIFKDQIRLSPFDPSKELNILTDGVNSAWRMKITEVITLDSSDNDATTVDWENSSSSLDDDIKILEQITRSRKPARV